MAVTCVFGMTQSGKSRLVERVIIPNHKRVLIFDIMNCFKTAKHRISMDSNYGIENTALDKAFEIAANNPEKFNIALITGKRSNEKKLFDKLIVSSFIIGDKLCTEDDKLLLVCDEASDICDHHFQSTQLEKLVKKGRHYNVDSLFIAQYPQMIHKNIRTNAHKVITFKMTTAPEIPMFLTIFGREICKRIVNLPEYHYVTWTDNGKIWFTNEKGRVYV